MRAFLHLFRVNLCVSARFWYARGGKERGRLICARSDTTNPGVRRRDAEGTPLVMPCCAVPGQLQPTLACLIRRSCVSLSLNIPQLFAALVFLYCANQEKHTAGKRRSGGWCCRPAVWPSGRLAGTLHQPAWPRSALLQSHLSMWRSEGQGASLESPQQTGRGRTRLSCLVRG